MFDMVQAGLAPANLNIDRSKRLQSRPQARHGLSYSPPHAAQKPVVFGQQGYDTVSFPQVLGAQNNGRISKRSHHGPLFHEQAEESRSHSFVTRFP